MLLASPDFIISAAVYIFKQRIFVFILLLKNSSSQQMTWSTKNYFKLHGAEMPINLFLSYLCLPKFLSVYCSAVGMLVSLSYHGFYNGLL